MVKEKKNIFVIIGSAAKDSANEKLINLFASQTKDVFDLFIFKDLKTLPHFDPELSIDNPPVEIAAFRNQIENARGVVICTPEYVFSIPSGLKNAIEWCVCTTLFFDKPTGLITASANREKGHDELQLIMKTLGAKFTAETTLLIRGIKGVIDELGQIKDEKTRESFLKFIDAFKGMLEIVK